MSCNCMKIIKEGILETQPLKGKKIIGVDFNTVYSLVDSNFIERPVIDVEFTIEGKKSKHKTNISYLFCPFCGKKYEFQKEEQEVPNG